MVKHIVMWRLHEQAHGVSKAENAQAIKQALEKLQGRIPGLLNIEVGLDFDGSEQAADLVLYSEFESRAALAAYQAHPLHQAVIPLVKGAARERTVVDYDL